MLGDGCFPSLTTVECGQWTVENRSSNGCVLRTRETKMDPRGNITCKKVRSPQNNLPSIFATKREKEKKWTSARKLNVRPEVAFL